MEKALIEAAKSLPDPTSNFSDILEKVSIQKSNNQKHRKFRRVLIVIVLLVLGSSTAIYAISVMNRGEWVVNRSSSYSDVQNLADQLNIVIPKQVGNYPFEAVTFGSVVPHGTPLSKAITNPIYKTTHVYYANQNHEPGPSVTIGDTLNTNWRSYFGFNEMNMLDEKIMDQVDAFEYKDHVLFVGISKGIKSIRWIDEQKSVVFSISSSNDADLFNVAHQIIKENSSE